MPVACIRLMVSLYCYHTCKLVFSCDITTSIWRLYKKRCHFPHPIGIVIGKDAEIGENCTIYQNVTIGAKNKAESAEGKYPKIGNNVIIYANSLIIGNLRIGDNSIIGAGTCVRHDLPDNCVAHEEKSSLKIKSLQGSH